MVRTRQEIQDMIMSLKPDVAREMQRKRSQWKLFVVGLVCYVSGFSHGFSSYGTRRATCECPLQGSLVGDESYEEAEAAKFQLRAQQKRIEDSIPNEYGTTMENNNHMIKPLERTQEIEFLPGHTTDTYTFFHKYLQLFGRRNATSAADKKDDGGVIATAQPPPIDRFPLLHIWPNFFEAYHNHWQRFCGQEKVVFMEIGVQSGGKIGLLRDYFGPGFQYVGIDINPSCKMFESEADGVFIEVGDSGNREFLTSLKTKYPHVDIFLDDGGHAMHQQRLAMEIWLPHISKDGVYAVEDLNTSWNSLSRYGGKRMADYRDEYFREETMMGLVHRTIDWLHYGWFGGRLGRMDSHDKLDGFWPESWWKHFTKSVKHIHVYNQIVFYEKGQTEVFSTKTIGYQLPFRDSGEHEKVNWRDLSSQISKYTGTNDRWQ